MYVTLPSDDRFEGSTQPSLMAPSQMDQSQKRGRVWNEGQSLYHEGEPSARVYEIISGVLRLSRVLENGRRQVIAFGYPGDIVGFASEGYHHTECDVIARAEVVSHNADILEDGASQPLLQKRLLKAALNEISGMQDHFLMLGRKKSHEKLASFFAVLSKRVGTPVGSYTQFKLT